MNKLRKIALARWKRDLDERLAKIPSDKISLIKKAALCGFLAGDGSVQIRRERKGDKFYRYQLDFFPDDDEMLSTYLSFVKDLYDLKPSIRRRYNVYIVRLSQRVIVLDLLNISPFGIYKWGFPIELFSIDGAKEAWLRAFFSAEGYVGKKYIKTQSVNLKSIRCVRDMLGELGIRSTYCEYTPKNKNHSKVGMIFVCDKKSRTLFYNRIGFWHKRKSDKLKQTLGL